MAGGRQTVFERTLLYDSVDVAPLLRPGAANALGVALGRGWYSCSGVWLDCSQLQLETHPCASQCLSNCVSPSLRFLDRTGCLALRLGESCGRAGSPNTSNPCEQQLPGRSHDLGGADF